MECVVKMRLTANLMDLSYDEVVEIEDGLSRIIDAESNDCSLALKLYQQMKQMRREIMKESE